MDQFFKLKNMMIYFLVSSRKAADSIYQQLRMK